MPKTFLCVGPWTEKKLHFLKNYLQVYVKETSKSFSRYVYIDGFAGPGKNFAKETSELLDGSPLIAMSVIPAFTDYVFIELDDMNFLSLKQYVFYHPTYKKSNVCLRYGDCNWCIPNEILPRIPSQTPIFAFLDPFGLEIRWATVKELAKKKNVTTLITFSYMGVKRLMGTEGKVLDDFYGSPMWASIAKRRILERLTAEQARRAFLELYMSQLRSAFGHANHVFSAKANDIIYCLILASTNEAIIKAADSCVKVMN
jgi:three-Cys-motif partner protein